MSSCSYASSTDSAELNFQGVYIAGKPENVQYDVCCKQGVITSMTESQPDQPYGGLLVPSLCHPHIHLDKSYLLSHPKYADLEIEKGDFAEAMKLTSEAKARFDLEDLMERGRALIQESINFGVTHMRAFVEVDLGVKLKCLEAGLALKEEFSDRCHIQICVFAQDPIFSYRDSGRAMQRMLENAASKPGVEAFGSTPYVESNGDLHKQIANIEYAIKIAKRYKLHLDFHIDYNLDPNKQSMVIEALRLLHKMNWPSNFNYPTYRTIIFGHCTRLTLFTTEEWEQLQEQVRGLPISFVGLPSSDLFMMGRPTEKDEGSQRVRGTLQVLQVIRKYGMNAVIGVNNVGNAFTPQGSADPLALASLGVGLYQAGTKQDTDLLLQCVSNRAKLAMGIVQSTPYEIDIDVSDPAEFVVFGSKLSTGSKSFRARRTIQDVVYDPAPDRITVYNGEVVSEQ
ncbi:Metallo-dependent hydrolase [Mollisia scopiformis]|uniref:Metallo-dependent hydrolase n=1 Tax=Mollisia scopiformis TaxID=149040 RepID=A0A132B8L5_MOLSC|nr:Metallo-dependent hydrolase [Mollisia scopiformis]KUJ08593.1 Metallo-dependent hydrolase [Mollisia scopiformis]